MSYQRSFFLACSLAGVALGACSAAETANETAPSDVTATKPRHDTDAGAPIADAAPDTTRPHLTPPPLPIIPNQGGPILAAPEVVTVTWSGDALAADLEAFDTWWVASATWKTIMAEWGVGPGMHVASVRLTGAHPSTLAEEDVDTLLRAGFTSGTIPPPNGRRVYMIYPPTGTEVTSFGAKGCEGFQAYHSAVDVPASSGGTATKAYFSITPRCADTQGMNALDFTTWGASHELMEAASDPQADRPAWRIDVQSLATPQQGENADLCAGHPTRIEGHMITRNWSNVAAKAGARPCVPAPPGPMFGMFGDIGEITVTPGKTTKLKVHAYASGAFGSFHVGTFALDPALTAKLSVATASDGDELTLSVTPSTDFVEQPGANLVVLYAESSDYSTRRAVLVHGKP